MALDLMRHPCFSDTARHEFGRVHLPVAPRCNMQCNFCDRQFDCMNESRPGVTSQVLEPHQALWYLMQVTSLVDRIAVVGIAGPGDPFANANETIETMRLVRQHFPDMLLCVASNGLNVLPHLDEIAAIGVSHFTVTMNAVDPAIGAQIYRWMRVGRRIRTGLEAATILRDRQLEVIAGLKERGMTVKINTIVIPGVNEHHVGEVARTVAALGADILNCIPLIPVENTPFGELDTPSAGVMNRVRQEASDHLPQMRHCARCRADAVGMLGHANTQAITDALRQASARMVEEPGAAADRPYIAVATMEGVLVNQHLGMCGEISVYQRHDDGQVTLIEQRAMPGVGGGTDRWRELASLLDDCHALVANAVGHAPREVLEDTPIRVYEAEGFIEEVIESIHNGQTPRAAIRMPECAAGCGVASNCGGQPGMGCG